jgi:hypothetical protein
LGTNAYPKEVRWLYRATSLAGIIDDYRLLAVQAADNRPNSDDDKIDAYYVIKYPGENHYDDAKNKSNNSPY